MGGNGLLLAVSMKLQELRKKSMFKQVEDVPRLLVGIDLDALEVCLDGLNTEYEKTLRNATQLLDTKLRASVGYPPSTDSSIINLNYWHDALTYLRCHLSLFDFPSGVPFALGDGPVDMGLVVLYGLHVFVVIEGDASALPKAPCGCTLSNFLLRQCYPRSEETGSLVPGKEMMCTKCNMTVPVELLLQKEMSSVPQAGEARPKGSCVLCGKPTSSSHALCAASCYCLVCGVYQAKTQQNPSECANCSSPVRTDLIEKLALLKAKCLCGRNISPHTEGFICRKGHVLCGKCCFLDPDHSITCHCKESVLYHEVGPDLQQLLTACSICEVACGETQNACKHWRCQKCQAAKVCKRCAAIKQDQSESIAFS
jgi:hypothetical protein